MSTEKDPQVTAQRVAKTVQEKYADVTLRLIEDHGDKFGPLTPEKEKKLRRKLYLHLMVLISAINLVLFVSMTSINQTTVILTILDRQIYAWLRCHSWAF